jgi:hypothetical protein
MGGNALKGFVERKNKEDHQRIVPKVLLFLTKFTKAEEVKYLNDKESFGDADIVVQYRNDEKFDWMIDEVVLNFKPKAQFKNSNVFSFELDGHQIDLIFTEEKFYGSSLAYFANNDLGNLVGRIAHKHGFKYGHEGLVYVMREDDRVIEEINVSQDQDLIYKFLGYDERKTDFENLDGMFEFVATSEYFDPGIYLLHNRNHVSRVRDAKRPTYNAFLKWCEEHPEKTKFRFPTDGDLKDYFKYIALRKAFSMFPNFLEKYDETEMIAHKNKELGKVFNGNVVSSLTGLTGKDLGGFMKFCKSDLRHDERVMHDVNEWVNLKLKEWKENKNEFRQNASNLSRRPRRCR